MRLIRRRLALLLSLPLAACAELAQMACHGEAERAGTYLGTAYAGTSCTTYPGHARKGRVEPGPTVCTPNFRPVYQWDAHSDRIYAICMAEVARRYPTRATVLTAGPGTGPAPETRVPR